MNLLLGYSFAHFKNIFGFRDFLAFLVQFCRLFFKIWATFRSNRLVTLTLELAGDSTNK